MAAMATTRTEIPGINEEKIIGLVGGMDVPVIHNFVIGFEQGARDIDPEVKVEVVYTGSFEDPAKGKEATLAIIDKGADVVFQVAGKTGEGIIEACKEKGVYVIGVDSDQGWLAPGTVIESMMKEVGMSIYETIKKFQDGTYEKGAVYSYGVKEDGVGPTFSNEYAKILPQDIIDKMKEIEQKIVSGEIVVEEYE
jgi:basic membrane protein A